LPFEVFAWGSFLAHPQTQAQWDAAEA